MSSSPRTCHLFSHVFRVRVLLVASALGTLFALMPGAASATWVLNQTQFDDGTCNNNVAIGSDPTTISSATPWFLLYGDGNHSSYRVFVDGVAIGTFSSDSRSNVCISTANAPLSEGAHVLTANELAPNASNVVAPFNFSVDTVPPPAPSTPVLASYSDSGVMGDNVTMFPNPSFTGTSEPNQQILLYDGVAQIGGAVADSTGHWTARPSPRAAGVHSMTARAVDEANNYSAPSGALSITIDTAVPVTALTSPTSGSTVSGTTTVAANASDNVGVWKVDFQVDGVSKATDTTSPYAYAWDSTAVANGSHTLSETTTDLAGNTATSSVTVTVNNGAAPTVPGAPSLVSASAGSGSVALAWSAPASDGGAAVSGYRVYRGTVSGGETLLTTVGNVTGWTDSLVVNGVTYYYKVSAVNSVGEGASSNERSATPVAAATVPGAPSARFGLGRERRAWRSRGARRRSDGGAAVTGYRVYRGTSTRRRDAAHDARQRDRRGRTARSRTGRRTTTRSPP